jgi:coenzyme F420-reducing hydrogenase gamma subunit
MPNPTLSEIHEARKLLDQQLTEAINSFTKNTGVKVASLRIDITDSIYPGCPPRTYKVKSEIEF